MKRIGLIGGVSWHSTAIYYQRINEEINRRLEKQHSADPVLISLDFESLLVHWQQGHWDEAIRPIISAIKQLDNAGADFFMVCSNAVHNFSDQLIDAANQLIYSFVSPFSRSYHFSSH